MKLTELLREDETRQWFTYAKVPGWFVVDESKLKDPDPVKAGLFIAGPLKSEFEADDIAKKQKVRVYVGFVRKEQIASNIKEYGT